MLRSCDTFPYSNLADLAKLCSHCRCLHHRCIPPCRGLNYCTTALLSRRSHEFIYKQAVASTDAFLGMSGKDPSSTCCEELVVRIELPEASSAAGELFQHLVQGHHDNWQIMSSTGRQSCMVLCK